MKLPFKLKRSAGIAVTASVHDSIRQGNAARDRRDWNAAAVAYRTVLDTDSTLRHIWIQLGHMLKENDRTQEAIEAYLTAVSLMPDDPEPLVHIAHLYKSQNDARSAVRYFVKAIRTPRSDDASLNELQAEIGRFRMIDTASLSRAVRYPGDVSPTSSADPNLAKAVIDRVLSILGSNDAATLKSASAVLARLSENRDTAPLNVGEGFVFDVTDLVGHFRHHRLPTGIQRVQIEVVTRALRAMTGVRVCCFSNERDCLLEIPGALFVQLAEESTAGTDNNAPEWMMIVARLFIHLIDVDPFIFQKGETLVNLGTSWWIYNYYLIIRNAKLDCQIKYISFVHDLIPIVAADHCVTGVIEDYINWLVGVFDHADHFLVNSISTGKDLILAAKRLGRLIDPGSITIVPLDADFRQPAAHELRAEELGRWNLSASKYCLIVSTIESRKNHVLVLDAWARLISAHGLDHTPILVCVGRSGWMNDSFFERLRRDPRLRGKVKLIERVSDDELALLYRSCSFTIYPSHYEGWGLPVTESLCYGRVPVVADNSSLREAGGPFALFFESNTASSLVSALEEILFEDGVRENLEEQIAAHFRPRSWASITSQILGASLRTDQIKEPSSAPVIKTGKYYPTNLYKGTRIWSGLGSGEIFRSGNGWLWPDTSCSRTTASGGTLRMQVFASNGGLRLYLRLCGLDSRRSTFVVSAFGETIATGSLQAGERRWIMGNIPAPGADAIVTIVICGGSVEEINMMTGGTPKRLEASIGIAGLSIVECADESGRVAFVQNAALGSLDDINAYAEQLAIA